MNTRQHILATLAAFALAIAPAHAATFTWTGTIPADADWNNAANWSGGVVPTGTADLINLQNGFGPVLSGTTNLTIYGIWMADEPVGDPENEVRAAYLTLKDDAYLNITGTNFIPARNNPQGQLYFSLSGNSYFGAPYFEDHGYTEFEITDNARFDVRGQLIFGYGGTSSMTVTGNSHVNAGTFQLGRTIYSQSIVYMADSSTLTTGNFNVGNYRGQGRFTATDDVIITAMGAMIIGVSDGNHANAHTGWGEVYLDGNVKMDIRQTISVGNFSRGELHIAGDASVITNGVTISTAVHASFPTTSIGQGLITLSGSNSGRGSLTTSYLTRGVATTGTVVFDVDGEAILPGTVVFDGGILRSNTTNAAFIGSNSADYNLDILIKSGGAYIDSNGFDIGITSAVNITGSGALNKLGAGSLTLEAIPLYTGSTIVQEGTLVLTQIDHLASSAAVAVHEGGAIRTAGIDQTLNALSGSGLVDLDNGALAINSDVDTVFSGEIIAVGGLIKTGTGALTLSGNNILGDVTVYGGNLGIGNASALGVNTVTIAGDGAIRADANITIANAINTLGTSLKFNTLGDVTMVVNGAVASSFGIVKDGIGTISLAGDSSGVTGDVDINEGTLLVAGLGMGSFVNVADGGGFGGSGIINAPVTYAGSGALQIGSTHNDSLVTAPATITITNGLSLGDTILKFDTFAGNASDKLIADTINIGGQIGMDFSMLRLGTYTLIETTVGTLNPSLALPGAIDAYRTGFQASARESLAYSLSPDNKVLSVTITKTSEALTWTGGGGDTWDYNNTASWTGGDMTFVDGDRVTFAATGSNTISIDRNNVTAGDMTITGNGSYTFTGEGRITTDDNSTGSKGGSFGADATGKFVMEGTGTVTFANASNVFLGGVEVNSGAVVGDADSLGKNTDITTTGNGTVIFHQDNNTSYIGRLHGEGYFAKTGSGALTFTAADSTATGTFDVREGALLLSSGARLGDVDIATGATLGGSGIAMDVHAQGGSTIRVGIAVAGPDVGTETLTLRTLNLGNTARIIGTGTLIANVVIESGATGIAEIAETRELVLDGSIGGPGGFTKQGLGGLILTQSANHAGATTIEAGYIRAGASDVFSANSPHIIKPGGTLHLNGYNQSIRSIANEGTVSIGAPGIAGTRLALANGYTGVAGSTIVMNLRAADNIPTIVDQIIVQGGEITGRTAIRVDVTDLRANPNAFEAYLNDIPALITYEAGDMPSNVFTVTDGISSNRVVIGMHDYRLYYYEDEARLLASDSAEVPAVLAINSISLAVNRGTLNSIGQRLDYLHDLQTAENNKNRDVQFWLQGYYRRDRFYGSYWADTSGAQAGFDIPATTSLEGTVIYGMFADYSQSSIDIADVFNQPTVKLLSKSFGAYLALQHGSWCVDFVAKHTWDDYTINVVDTPEFDTTGASWGGFMRVSYAAAINNGWTLVPQTQLIFQARGVHDAKDAYGRIYTFGQKYARIDQANSLEGRISLSARRLIKLKNGKTLQPWITAGYFYDFKGDMTVTLVNENGIPVPVPPYQDDLGGGSFQVNAGLSAQLGKRLTAIIDVAMQTGGKIDSYSFNAGLSYRW